MKLYATFKRSLAMYEGGVVKEGDPDTVRRGPFDFLQLTYNEIQREDGGLLAFYDPKDGYWHDLIDAGALYSDVVIVPVTEEGEA